MAPFKTLSLQWSEPSPESHDLVSALLDGRSGPIYVLGRNRYAERVASAVVVTAFVDDHTESREFAGKPVVRMADIPSGAVAVSCVVDGRPLTALSRLHESRATQVVDYFTLVRIRPDLFETIAFCANNEADVRQNFDKYEWLFGMLADETSRLTLQHLVQFRATFDVNWMKPFSLRLEQQYFEDFVPFVGEQVFVDGGGYDGQTTKRFLAAAPRTRRVYYFEPSAHMMTVSQTALQGMPNVVFCQKALADYNGTARFDASGGPTSHFASGGESRVPVVRLDDEVKEAVTTIKLDVEGAECAALRGAQEQISRHRPSLAVCVYHDQRHFWEVPETVLRFRQDYSLFLRHYSEGVLESVMYFVPSS